MLSLPVDWRWKQRRNKIIGITAQVSLYPLGQAALAPAIDETLQIFQKHGLDVLPGSMSSVIVGDDATVFEALQDAFQRVAEKGEVVMVVTFSNACPVPEKVEISRGT